MDNDGASQAEWLTPNAPELATSTNEGSDPAVMTDIKILDTNYFDNKLNGSLFDKCYCEVDDYLYKL